MHQNKHVKGNPVIITRKANKAAKGESRELRPKRNENNDRSHETTTLTKTPDEEKQGGQLQLPHHVVYEAQVTEVIETFNHKLNDADLTKRKKKHHRRWAKGGKGEDGTLEIAK